MSALPVVTPEPRRPSEPRQRLRLVPRPRARMARLPFLTVLIALVGAGMVGLLLLNTALQNQAFEASQLRRQAAEMSYAEGELEQLVTEAGSARELSRRATALGMRPNRDIAFIQLETGLISGDPRASDGLYLPSALTRSPEEIAKAKAEKAAKRAEERRAREQQAMDGHRQRIIDARSLELDERRRAAETAQQAPGQERPEAGQDDPQAAQEQELPVTDQQQADLPQQPPAPQPPVTDAGNR